MGAAIHMTDNDSRVDVALRPAPTARGMFLEGSWSRAGPVGPTKKNVADRADLLGSAYSPIFY